MQNIAARRDLKIDRLTTEGLTQPKATLVLASNSPRRKELLAALDLPFRVLPPRRAEELPAIAQSIAEIAESLALAKAKEVAALAPNAFVLAADTLVALDSQIFGKPNSPEEAETVLLRLRGRTHQVVTGVALAAPSQDRYRTLSRLSHVTMRRYTLKEIKEYVVTGSPMDKAGAYAVQDGFFRPASRVDGCYLNVVGLPLCSVVELLEELGIKSRPRAGWRPPENCRDCPLLRCLEVQ